MTAFPGRPIVTVRQPAASTSFVLATLRALHMDPATGGQQSGSDPRKAQHPESLASEGSLTTATDRAHHQLAATAPGPRPVPCHWRTGGPYSLADDRTRLLVDLVPASTLADTLNLHDEPVLGHCQTTQTLPMTTSRHRRPARRSSGLLDDVAAMFAHAPWWAPLATLGVLLAGLAEAAHAARWPWSTTEPVLMVVAVLVGLTGIMGQLEKQRLRKLLLTTRRLEDLRALSWRAFEDLVLATYRARRWNGSLTSDGADGGVDIILRKGNKTVYVQCKHWRTETVRVGPIRELKGSMASEGVSDGIFVATGSFSTEARRWAQDNGISVVDGPSLLRLLDSVRPNVKDYEQRHIPGRSTPPAPPSCPRCHEQMVMRRGPRGAFWGCRRFPSCRGTVNVAQ
jgi:restriction system protein